MNIYRHAIDILSIDPYSTHGENAWLLAVLQLGAQLNVTGSGNPFKAVIVDLKDRNVSPVAVSRIEQLLNTASQKWEAGQ